MSPEEEENEALCRHLEFGALREMHKVRDF